MRQLSRSQRTKRIIKLETDRIPLREVRCIFTDEVSLWYCNRLHYEGIYQVGTVPPGCSVASY